MVSLRRSGVKTARGQGAFTNPLEAKASREAAGYQLGKATPFQKISLEMFIGHCQQHHIQVVLIAGQVNPILSRKLSPELRWDFLQYLSDLPNQFPNVIVALNELPHHPESDYEDLMHVHEEFQIQYTIKLADFLQQKLGWRPGSSPSR